MGEQHNLTEENVEVLRKHLEDMKIDNPKLQYEFFREALQDKKDPTNRELLGMLEGLRDRIKSIEDKIKSLDVY